MKVAIIGSGNMGGSIALGLAKGSIVKASNIICTAKSHSTLNRMKQANDSFTVTTDNKQAVQAADIIILAIKPWLVENVIKEIIPVLDPSKHLLISVVAGLSLDDLKELLSPIKKLPIIRLIPNIAIASLESMTVLSTNEETTIEQKDLVIHLFNELGLTIEVPENKIAAATSIASCGTAFALRYMRAAMEAAIELGFYPKDAQEMVAQTVKGAAEILLTNETHPEIEIDKVTTPGGITIKGLNELEHAGFSSAVIRAIKKSTNIKD